MNCPHCNHSLTAAEVASMMGQRGGRAVSPEKAKARAKGGGAARWKKFGVGDVTIYAWKSERVFLYVGQTVEFNRRRYRHLQNRPEFADAQMMFLRRVSDKDANRVEGQIIAALKGRNQCALNHKIPAGLPVSKHGQKVICGGIQFESLAAAARHFGELPCYTKRRVDGGWHYRRRDDTGTQYVELRGGE